MDPNKRVFIIAEAGSNWKAGSARKDWCRACELVQVAKKAGADAVKFQTFKAQTVYVPNAGTSHYLSKYGICRSITEIFEQLSMPYGMIPKLARYCRRLGIEFMSSAFSPQDFEAVDPWVKRHKVASYEITYLELIRLAAKSRKPLILSTGASEYGHIDMAVKHFYKEGGRDLTLMQCTAKYPVPPQSLNLKVIPEFMRRYRVSVGLSDHSLDPVTAPVAAVALGARVIEKHFTLNRKLDGPDQAFAVEPRELEQMVRSIRDCEKALGDGRKKVLPQEKELFLYAQRAVQATRAIRPGDVLRSGVNIAVLRPGKQKKGLHPKFLNRIEGARAKRNIPLGCGILKKDFTK